ncbi:RNA methyltransferase [Granulicatella sp. zg-ZJ]|uniref:TrmH family RNA methyltransferase n=1 Tax=Granulicatella sp. zg-ZJ TaxID=2678504 RepID=UPI001967A9EB|nr:RNA methyltransferase [Granulicatella sp. zg-ZJ]
MIQEVTSLQNAQVKLWKKLLTAKGRKKEQLYVLEGYHLVLDALNSQQVLYCMMSKEVYERLTIQIDVPIYILSESILKEISETTTSQAIFCVVKMSKKVLEKPKGKYILLDSLQDPGNVGTIIRTADAAGFQGVVIGKNCVDIYNGKTVRSMQGSQFHIPIYHMDLCESIALFKKENISVFGTELNHKAIHLQDVPYKEHCAIIVGNEGNGIQKDILNMTTQNVYIPILGQAESLNVAVAAGIMMYHFVKK